MNDRALCDRLAGVLGSHARSIRPLSGGCVASVREVELADGRRVVVKCGGASLDVEGMMLRHLATHTDAPVPRVLHVSPDLLVMERVEGETGLSESAQRDLGRIMSRVHGVSSDRCGFACDTLIGPLRQPNGWHDSWVEFFGAHRLRHMADECVRAGALSGEDAGRVHRLADRLKRWIREPEHPQLVHGDLWAGNVLARGDRVTGLIDPAIYYGDGEVDLAFATLFGSFGRPFFEAYSSGRPIREGFFEVRRDLYNAYPLLVHVRLFGGGYVGQLRRVLGRFAR